MDADKEITLRAARPGDLDAICAILAAALPLMQQSGNTQWDESYPNRARFAEDILEGTLEVAKYNGALAGFICLNGERPAEYATMPWHVAPEQTLVIHRMAVHPELRGAGLARAMIGHCEQLARSRGCAAIHTDTNSQNEPMNALLRGMGYIHIGDITMRQNPHIFHCYEKLL